jgi:hypothetical protein
MGMGVVSTNPLETTGHPHGAKRVAETTPNGGFGGGFGHPLGSMGVAELLPVPTGGGFSHPLEDQGVARPPQVAKGMVVATPIFFLFYFFEKYIF